MTASRYLYEAIKSRWDATGLTADFPGGIWHSLAPQNPQRPYAVFSSVSARPSMFSTTSEYGDERFRISVFDKTVDDCLALIRVVDAAFHFAPLSLDGNDGDVLVMHHINEYYRIEEWYAAMGVIEYMVMRRKNVNYSPG